jgi:alpha-glucosidase
MKIALLAALRGNIIVYQGEELGLEQDVIPFELLQDPEAIATWPLTLSRDGVRTPMPWRDEALGGFTTGTPWLPLSSKNLARAAELQERDETSQLGVTRQVLALRSAQPALRLGALENCVADGDLLTFDRVVAGSRIRCLFNLSYASIDLPEAIPGTPILSINGATSTQLPGYGALYVAG